MALDNDPISPRETVVVLVAGMDTPNSRFISPSVIKGKVDRSRGGGDPTPTSLEKSSKSGQLDLFRKEDLRVYGANKKVNPPLPVPPTSYCLPPDLLAVRSTLPSERYLL